MPCARDSRTVWPRMSDATRLYRPATPPGHDPSRAAQRAADPRGWRFADDDLDAVYRVIAQRRDIRRFRPDPVPDDVLERVLAAAHRAPSVGLMQPWRLIVIGSIEARVAIRQLAQRERLRQAERFDERTRQFLDQKVEGIVEAPLGICVCCDHGEPDEEILGRGTIPDTDVYSTACAIQNLWLAARAEGLGVGWVSFYRLADLRALLGIPERVDPIAYLCLGWPDERPVRPNLETSGWAARAPVTSVVMHERWGDEASEPAPGGAPDRSAAIAPRDRVAAPGRQPDRAAAIAARDRADALVKPGGSLGSLETLVERWATVTGAPPPPRIRAGVLVCAADHGHTEHGTSLFGSQVSAQVAAAAARGETAAGVLAGDGGHRLLVVDVGLRGATPDGVLDRKIAQGSADMTEGAALTAHEVARACATGRELVAELLPADCLVLGEIGIGNTATAAALASLLTGAPASVTVGRGTGMDAAGLERKRALVARALRRHAQATTPQEILRAAGGLELAALAGAVVEAWELGLPVILDGFATAVTALVATRIQPAAAVGLFASHLSAERGHELVLTDLGLEPLLDLRMRLGEASGALLALPLIERAGLLHARMATFAEAGVDEQRR
ncbi:MAG: nicotinate-nucleotide--dimethylbenzimidazole phosphoribosyltransferase [Solirubrobacteraceae bacterium]|nr:nicotinate-nucleotide--dimethylbenzimidazole phosphoribosyltransferase [Solirubrobacteraceae bacterium]